MTWIIPLEATISHSTIALPSTYLVSVYQEREQWDLSSGPPAFGAYFPSYCVRYWHTERNHWWARTSAPLGICLGWSQACHGSPACGIAFILILYTARRLFFLSFFLLPQLESYQQTLWMPVSFFNDKLLLLSLLPLLCSLLQPCLSERIDPGQCLQAVWAASFELRMLESGCLQMCTSTVCQLLS